MKIKEIVSGLINSKKRTDYLIDYISSLKLIHNIQRYENNFMNIEVCSKINSIKKDILFFAHHDISNKTSEGANDNTSSVAVMLKICSELNKLDSKYNIKIVFNDNEELLGGLQNNYEKIIHLAGSYQYLKNYPNIENIKYAVILELSGIGDAIFLSKKSGYLNSDINLNQKIEKIVKLCNLKSYSLDIPPSDLYCVNIFNITGTVIGAIPSIQADNYLKDKSMTPIIWKNIHSDKDNIYTINERSLVNVYSIVKGIIEKID